MAPPEPTRQACSPKCGSANCKGYLEDCSPGRIAGWAQDQKHIDSPVRVAVLLDGAVVAEMEADVWRRDLEDAFIGDGCHAFEFRPVPPLSPEKLARLTVVRAVDGTELERLKLPPRS